MILLRRDVLYEPGRAVRLYLLRLIVAWTYYLGVRLFGPLAWSSRGWACMDLVRVWGMLTLALVVAMHLFW